MLHPLLLRQIRKAKLDISGAAPEWLALLRHVSHAYGEADQERYRIERSITICSEEMSELNEHLAAERDLFRGTFESAAVGMVRASLDGVIRDCNAAFARMLGYAPEELVGHNWLDLVHSEERDAAASAALSRLEVSESSSFDRRYTHRDGSTVFATLSVSTARDVTGAGLFHVAVVRDVTKERELEVELRHAQKLEAVGMLAAGVAHEINTPVQFIGDNLAFVGDSLTKLLALYASARSRVGDESLGALEREELDADLAFLAQEGPRAIGESLDGIGRVGGIVKAMKVLVHHDQGEGQTQVDLRAALSSVLTVARSETRHVAEVSLEVGDVDELVGFASDLNQVFLNLVINAAHAVGEVVARTGERGRITVRTRRDGEFAVVTIEDTGSGIPKEIRHRVFDPFFTTKEVGHGTGQGLSIARSIVVDKHGGSLTFDSEVGRGTTFLVRLPIQGRPRARGRCEAA